MQVFCRINQKSNIHTLIFAMLLCQFLVNGSDDFYDDVGNDWCGDCITTGNGPQVRKHCQFPFTINGEVFDKCLKRRRQDWWCPTQLDSSNNVKTNQWGFCNDCCPKGYINEIFYLREHDRSIDAQKVFCDIQDLDEKRKILRERSRYALQTFSRQSSDYLRYSVLSPKRFGQKEMKIEQKARPPPPKIPRFGGGSGGY